MADTDKQNFRYPRDRWSEAQAKAKFMREDGYDIDLTKLITHAVDRFLGETEHETAVRLGLQQAGSRVAPYRKPWHRASAE